MIHAKRIVLAWLQSLTELLLYFPMLVAVHVVVPHMIPAFPLWLAAMSGFYTLGYAFHYAFPSVWRWAALLLPVAAAGWAAWSVSGRTSFVIAANFVLWLFAWVRGRQNRLWGWDSSFPSGLLWIGLIGYFAASFLYPRIHATMPYAPWVTGFGVAALALTLYRTNALTLKTESLDADEAKRPQVSRETKWRNRTLVVAMFALIVLIAALPAIAGAVRQAVDFLVLGAIKLFLKLMGGADSGPIERPPQEPAPLEPELAPPSEADAFIDKLFYFIGVLLVLALAAWLLYHVSKYAGKWFRQFLDWYGERIEGPQAGYVDEKESLLGGKEWTRQRTREWKERWSGLFRKEPGWDDLPDNRERVRRAYRLLLLRRMAAGYKHEESRTPRETSREMNRRAPLGKEESAVIPLYEEARYGGRAITDEEAAAIKRLFDGK
ncbi:DUF4129 domain-containing protein [Paenibacillus sp. GYB003]|uniref:DUF4129 domain-containing protein n=1 Tax=Paenibacillus sp. GYB003 TaxID=2994392 RepID=UPI002F96B401